MDYQPIEDYGLIGDMHTAALVGKHGSVDWLCWPHFDSPSVFAALLDNENGGRFQLSPANEEVSTQQMYWPDTNILMTRFLCPQGVAEIVDYMPVSRPEETHNQRVIRQVNVVRGELAFEVVCRPAFNYARDDHTVEVMKGGACFYSEELSLALSTIVPLERGEDGAARASFVLTEEETATFVLQEIDRDSECPHPPSEIESDALFERTVDFWHGWLSQCTYEGRWRETVHRSALVLKLLTFQPTGAIVAAPTCSLPEHPGGVRNWDYRYTWLRDAAFTVYALLRIGFTEEATAFMDFLEKRCRELDPDGTLNVMYGIDGRHDLHEVTLDHLKGYRNSRPVRIGNAAYSQLQLDVYGELMDAVYLYDKYGSPISYDLWKELRKLVNWVCDNWKQKDEGVWETRGGRHHFVYSKVQCWVAVDRGLRIARARSFPADRKRWRKCRDEMYDDVMANGWSSERQAFVQHYDTESLDAANLILPIVLFVAPDDPKMIKTIDAINSSPRHGGLVSNSLVYRYNLAEFSDGLIGQEGTFSLCTFLLVEVLTRAGNGLRDPERIKEARLMFEKMLGYSNHLGLYAEETGSSGEALGNFPQAFTHLSLISAAFRLDATLDERRVVG